MHRPRYGRRAESEVGRPVNRKPAHPKVSPPRPAIERTREGNARILMPRMAAVRLLIPSGQARLRLSTQRRAV